MCDVVDLPGLHHPHQDRDSLRDRHSRDEPNTVAERPAGCSKRATPREHTNDECGPDEAELARAHVKHVLDDDWKEKVEAFGKPSSSGRQDVRIQRQP